MAHAKWALPAYIVGIAALYAAGFEIILAVAGPPVTGRLETAVVVLGISLMVSWLGTSRALQLSPTKWPRFLLPSVLHGFALAVIAYVIATPV